MSHTTQVTTTEELVGYHASWFRPLLTRDEYERQTATYTKQQLKDASLYNQHTFHFIVLSIRDQLGVLWNRKSLYTALVVAALAVAFVLFGVFTGPDPRHTEGGTLVPALTFSQRVAAASQGLLDRIRQFTGAQKSLILPEDRNVFGTYTSGASNSSGQGNTTTYGSPLGNEGYTVVVEANGNANPSPSNPETAALVDATAFTSFLHAPTYDGMNIFTFAFTVAKEFAVNIFAGAFGWSANNSTAVSTGNP